MLDLRLIREDPDGVRAALARRGEQAAAGLDAVIELDRRRRELLPELEGLRAEQNAANERIRAADEATRGTEIEAMRAVAGACEAARRPSWGAWRPSCRTRSRRSPTCPTRPRRPAPRTSSSGSAARFQSSASSLATTSSWPGR